MEILSSAYFVGNFFAITLPILVSVWLGNRQTQKIIRNTNEQTQRVIQEIVQNTSKQTQRVIQEIVQNTNAQTQRVIREIVENTSAQTHQVIQNTNAQILKVLNEIKQLQQDMKCLLEKTHALQKDTLCVLRKLDFGFKANALMHGWRRADGVSPEEAAKLPEPKIYDASLRVCYYRAD
jgi:vacuolar-type H+-ATPase subunit H